MGWRGVGLAGFVAMAAFAGGVAVGFVLLQAPPPSLAGSDPLPALPVSSRQFDDSRTVTLEIRAGEPGALASPVSGRVTAVGSLSRTLVSGEQVVDVDGKPVVALATAVPLWRDLPDGERGSDVSALQTELKRLGRDVEVTGVVDRATLVAAAQALGIYDKHARLWATIPANNWLWLPAAEVAVDRVEVQVGQFISTDTKLVSLPPDTPRLSVGVPPDALAGERVIDVGAESYSVEEDGKLRDPLAIESVMASPQYAIAKTQSADPQVVTLRVPWRLAKPLSVFAAPPQAVFGINGQDACVQVEGNPVAVKIVASELGQALVTSATDLRVVDANPSATCPST